MQGGCLLQVVFALTSLILSKAEDVIGSGHSCLRSRPADDGHTRVTFLRGDKAGVRSLYLSLWSEDMRLVTCEVNTDPLVTERYRSLCARSGAQGQEVTKMFNIGALLAPDAPCALVSSGAPKFTRRTRRDGSEGKARRKRTWIFPGTLWCGTGSKAVGYEQLGMFESADRCCREHDHCLHVIPAFTVNYGTFNPKFFTVSHCDCDQRFRQCLLGVNDTISNMVGYSFFNILQVPCFELKQQKQCMVMHWGGTCKVAKEVPYAVFKSPLPYNTSDITSKYGNNTDSNILTSTEGPVPESPAINPHIKSPNSEHRCSSGDPPRGDTFYRRSTKGKGCKKHRKLCTVAPSQIPPISRAHTTTPSMKKAFLNASKSSALMSNKKRVGKKKSTRKCLSAYPTQRSEVPPQVTTPSYPPTTSTTLLRDDAFRPHCKSCLEQRKNSHKATVTSSTTTLGLPIKVTTLETLRLKKTTETPKRDSLKTLWSTATSAMLVTTKLKTATSLHENGKPLKQMDSHLLWDNQLLCGSLKHLDECKYKIPPLEKKYDLQNMESKTAYHCDCTSRLAVQIESFKQPSILPTLLMDFVSQYCFKLPKEKKCHSRKSCFGSFTDASDLLRALKKTEERDTGRVRNSGNARKRGIPVRLYKRCLRLEREADIMAQPTQL
ncbi:group 3 secretory phospholipase A2-like isoform X2 [Siniperca chuatsi]|uniref:group 3 secretory phospholipase A2-like isoform X2 n=1 Tax=Siniperca chuatsi TaxID=119488 RepID=UPI001CE0887B|nr:group 3 secretory phospholipase A2-like isoform X2 [Siniperca chuatsi]